MWGVRLNSASRYSYSEGVWGKGGKVLGDAKELSADVRVAGEKLPRVVEKLQEVFQSQPQPLLLSR